MVSSSSTTECCQQQQSNSNKSGGLLAGMAFVLSLIFVLSNAGVLYRGLSLSSSSPSVMMPTTTKDYSFLMQQNNNHSNTSSELCQSFATRSAMSLWVNHITDILHSASDMVDDNDEETTKSMMHDIMNKILAQITPRLPRTIKMFPTQYDIIHRLLKKGFRRYQFLQYQQQAQAQAQVSKVATKNNKGLRDDDEDSSVSPPPPPPIQIAIFGGSVTVGANCKLGSLEGRTCAWPYLLEHLINQWAGGELIKVFNHAIGGTPSSISTTLLRYNLFLDDAYRKQDHNENNENEEQPDIIINSHSTNDANHFWGGQLKDSENAPSLEDALFDMSQDFIRTVLTRQQQCLQEYQPLLIYFDDFLGNGAQSIDQSMVFSQTIQQLASYYGFGYLSFPDAVRDLVYIDTKWERTYSSNWYKSSSNGNQMNWEVHPGVGMHLTSTIILSYFFLDMATTYCNLEPWNPADHDRLHQVDNYENSLVPGLEPMEIAPNSSTTTEINNNNNDPNPKLPPHNVLPPKLTKTLQMADISNNWQQEARNKLNSTKTCSSASPTKRHQLCPFSWSPISKQGYSMTTFEPFFPEMPTTTSTTTDETPSQQKSPAGDWEIIDDTGKGKYGWVPIDTSPNAEPLILDFDYTGGNPIRTVLLFTLKSYGEKWMGSKAQVSVYELITPNAGVVMTNNNQSRVSHNDDDDDDHDSRSVTAVNINGLVVGNLLERRVIIGYHDFKVSRLNTEEIHLPNNIITSKIRVVIKLIGGTTFKIQGLSVCR